MGRCSRRRMRRNTTFGGAASNNIQSLYGWMRLKTTKVDMSLVCLRNFADSGRGFMAKKDIGVGQMIISVPSEYFVTTSSIWQSPLKSIIERFQIKLSPMEALSLFLIFEKSLGRKSEWFAYISNLPQSFSLPLMWSGDELQSLPAWVVSKVDDQRRIVGKSFQKLKRLLVETCADAIADVFAFEDFLWAWSVITSRSAFMPQPRIDFLNSEPDNYVLIPFLDMFNHMPTASVSAGFNVASMRYEIRTNVACKKHCQVFINYGNHDNVELLLGYGFVVPKNPFDSISFAVEEVICAARSLGCLHGNVRDKLEFITKNNHDKYLLISYEGISWNLTTTIDILTASRQTQPDHFVSLEDAPPDGKIHRDIIRCMLSKSKLLPAFENRSSRSFNVSVADQLCSSFKQIMIGVLGS